MLVGISIVVAAIATAAISHVLIDALGDVLLAHDAYDDIDHRSRAVVLAGGASVVASVLLRLWFEAFAEVRRPHGAMREILGDAAKRARSTTTGFATVALALLALVGMETFDIARAGGSDFGPQAALGGSVGLGVGVTLAIGALVAALVPRALSWFGLAFALFVVVAREATIALAAPEDPAFAHLGRSTRRRRTANESILSWRAGKRAPPQSSRFA